MKSVQSNAMCYLLRKRLLKIGPIIMFVIIALACIAYGLYDDSLSEFKHRSSGLVGLSNLFVLLYILHNGATEFSSQDSVYLLTRPITFDVVYRYGLVTRLMRVSPILIICGLFISLSIGLNSPFNITIPFLLTFIGLLSLAVVLGCILDLFLEIKQSTKLIRRIIIVGILIIACLLIISGRVWLNQQLYALLHTGLKGSVTLLTWILISYYLIQKVSRYQSVERVVLTRLRTSKETQNMELTESPIYHNLLKLVTGVYTFALRQVKAQHPRLRYYFLDIGLIFACIFTGIMAFGLTQTVDRMGQTLPAYFVMVISGLIAAFTIVSLGTSKSWFEQIHFYSFDLYPYSKIQKLFWISAAPLFKMLAYSTILIGFVAFVLTKSNQYFFSTWLLVELLILELMIPYCLISYLTKRNRQSSYVKLMVLGIHGINIGIMLVIIVSLVFLYRYFGEKNIHVMNGLLATGLVLVIAVSNLLRRRSQVSQKKSLQNGESLT